LPHFFQEEPQKAEGRRQKTRMPNGDEKETFLKEKNQARQEKRAKRGNSRTPMAG
jgi:hypothetical protein